MTSNAVWNGVQLRRLWGPRHDGQAPRAGLFLPTNNDRVQQTFKEMKKFGLALAAYEKQTLKQIKSMNGVPPVLLLESMLLGALTQLPVHVAV